MKTCQQRLGNSTVRCGAEATRTVHAIDPTTGWAVIYRACDWCAAEILTSRPERVPVVV